MHFIGAVVAPAPVAVVDNLPPSPLSVLNALGIVCFNYGNSLVPEMQATLALVPPDNNSVRPMLQGTAASFAVICSLYIVVSAIGYWKFGYLAPGFLLSAFTTPAWLIATANAMCSFQLFVAGHVYAFPVYEACETALLRRFGPARGWARRVRKDEMGQKWVSPSLVLTLLVRTPLILFFTFVAAALPFFPQILGFLGAVGFTPLTFLIPPYLYLTARGIELARWQRAGLWAFIAFFTLFGIGAAVGSMRAIIVSASSFTFFS